MRFLKNSLLLLLAFSVMSAFCGCGKAEEIPSGSEAEIPAESEAEPAPEPEKVPVLCGIDTYMIILNDEESFNVGENLSVDEYGRVSFVEKRYETTEIAYDENGFVSEAVTTDKEDGTQGFEKWFYEEGRPFKNEYEPNDGFRYSRITDFEIVTDENGFITEFIENETFTDPEDGSISHGVDKYEIEYDEEGRLASAIFSSDGEIDHITVITYDEYGNILSYSNRDYESGKEYLRIEFRYELVPETEVSFIETDSFTDFCNFIFISNYIL